MNVLSPAKRALILWVREIPGLTPGATGMPRLRRSLSHGENDQAVPVGFSRKIVAAIKKAGGNVKYTEYPSAGHNIWLKVVKEPELLSWLFAQHK